jgi:hypothetical protein
MRLSPSITSDVGRDLFDLFIYVCIYLFVCKFNYIVIADICCEEYDLRGCTSCVHSEEAARKSTPKTTPTAGLRRNFHLDRCLWRKFRELYLTDPYKEEQGTRKLIRMYEYARTAACDGRDTPENYSSTI